MAAQVRHLIQDENLNVHHKGKDSNVSKAKKAAGFGGKKPLNNITNSGKPSPLKMTLKKNFLKNEKDFEDNCQPYYKSSQNRALIQNENLNAGCEGASVAGKSIIPKSQKKATGISGRKALSNITNSNTSTPYNRTRKNHPKKFSDIGEEQCLHNHQECIISQTRGMDMDLLLRTIGFEDDLTASPMLSVSSAKAKADTASPTPKFLELEEITELQSENYSPPRCCWTNSNPFQSPSPNRFFSTPKWSLQLLDLH